MDNLFDYIIILFFIFSLLLPLFKKKKQKDTAPKSERSGTFGNVPQNQHAPQKEKPKDLLEELFGLKLPQEQTRQQTTPHQMRNESAESWNPEDEFENKLSADTSSAPLKEQKDKMSHYDKLAEQVLSRKSGKDPFKDTLKVIDISKKEAPAFNINKINNPTSLQEYIVFSEILNKPKALRR
ncbi:MAG: hypothetical protein K9J16_01345 [Melioribacteraceae bacterium]|nr:hypothetical protein [Melioribacteraceae bacterium]MCF8352844.1 hypothetical protein [Melioribacteraceae bacterium]